MKRAGSLVSLALTAFVLLSLMLPAPCAAQGNLLVNGGFEQPDSSASPYPWGFTYGVIPTCDCDVSFQGCCIPGWSISQGTIDVLSEDWPAAEGRQSIDLVGSPGAAAIGQTFATVPGRNYTFTGYVSHNPGVPYGLADVSLNGNNFVQLASFVPSTHTDMYWQAFSYPFRATAASTTLMIRDVTGLNEFQGTALDGLAVSELPPAQQTQILLSSVNSLVGTALDAGNGNALTSKLNAALAQINRGNKTAAANQLGAFINQVNALVQSGRLSADVGQTLASSAQAIIQQLNS